MSNLIYMSMNEVRNKASGHFFEPSNQKVCDSRYGQWAYGLEGHSCVYFVTSEKRDAQTERKYTVRCFNKCSGEVTSESAFQAFAYRDQALRFIKRKLGVDKL